MRAATTSPKNLERFGVNGSQIGTQWAPDSWKAGNYKPDKSRLFAGLLGMTLCKALHAYSEHLIPEDLLTSYVCVPPANEFSGKDSGA